jgi:hypothetical protein
MFSYDYSTNTNLNSKNHDLSNDYVINMYNNITEKQFTHAVRTNTLPEVNKLKFSEQTLKIAVQIYNTNLYDNNVTFDKWLYQKRELLQFLTVEEMFYVFNCKSEPNGWIDETLEKMYNEHVEEEESCTSLEEEEMQFNLEWDIEKGRF